MQLVIDWHVTEAEVLAVSAKERELQDIMETWEALSLYSLAGFHQLRLIPDNEIMLVNYFKYFSILQELYIVFFRLFWNALFSPLSFLSWVYREKITSIHQMLSEDDRKGETGVSAITCLLYLSFHSYTNSNVKFTDGTRN